MTNVIRLILTGGSNSIMRKQGAVKKVPAKKQQLVHDGHTRHRLSPHLAHHDILQEADKSGTVVEAQPTGQRTYQFVAKQFPAGIIWGFSEIPLCTDGERYILHRLGKLRRSIDVAIGAVYGVVQLLVRLLCPFWNRCLQNPRDILRFCVFLLVPQEISGCGADPKILKI